MNVAILSDNEGKDCSDNTLAFPPSLAVDPAKQLVTKLAPNVKHKTSSMFQPPSL